MNLEIINKDNLVHRKCNDKMIKKSVMQTKNNYEVAELIKISMKSVLNNKILRNLGTKRKFLINFL